MRAIVYRKSVPRYVVQRLLARRARRLAARLMPVSLRQIPEPELPTDCWVRIAPKLSGICGSDLATVAASGSPYLAPLTSVPFVLGHELIGIVTETGSRVTSVQTGQRVVLRPALGCRARSITPLCDACARVCDALCRNVTRGSISAGIQTGYCRDTGGAWSESLVAHESQVYALANGVSDAAAVLAEPFACALHGALRVSMSKEQTVLVIGCGSVGLLTIAALRAVGCPARIVAVARYDHQREHARRLGADVLLAGPANVRERYALWAEQLDAEVHKPELGKPAVVGGADVTFDCVASSQTIDDAIRFTRSGGTLVLVGMPGIPSGIDWTPLWYKELTIRAAYAYGPERVAGRTLDTIELAIELLPRWDKKLSPLVGQPFALGDFRRAIGAALSTGESKAIKTVFDLHYG